MWRCCDYISGTTLSGQVSAGL
jgi:hypothetical protein